MHMFPVLPATLLVAAGVFAFQAEVPQSDSRKPPVIQFKDQLVLPPPPPQEDEFRVKSEVDIVLLDVSVKDAKGGFVAGLTKDQFQVFENKTPQDLTIFAAQDAPVTVGLIVDNSGSVRPKKAEVVTSAMTFVRESNPKDEVFIVNFNDRVRMGLPDNMKFSDNPVQLRQALMGDAPQGRTALNDAIYKGLQHLEAGRLDKKTLVVISDGGDNASDLTHDELVRHVEQSLATIYTVGIFNPQDRDKNPGFLKELARLTGGEYYEPESIEHLVGICQKIAHDIRNRYTLGYSPKDVSFDGKRRKLRVVAMGDGGRRLEARTRSHYIAPSRERARNSQ